MKFKSEYFACLEDAMAVANRLVDDDRFLAADRQIVANFYNGRDTMTSAEAESENIGNVVNHLFGYNNIDKFRSQISSIFTRDDTVWNVEINHPEIPLDQSESFSVHITQALARRIKRSRRIKPEWRATSGNLVLHGRDTQVFPDAFDWCPRSTFFYVPRGTQANRDSIPYAFRADDMPYAKLVSYLRQAEAAEKQGVWNVKALKDAVESLKPSNASPPLIDKSVGTEKLSEHDNNAEGPATDGDINTRSTLPVWYLYEVDHTKADKPVSLKILARYSLMKKETTVKTGIKDDKEERDILLYQNENHFKSVRNWVVPFFIDTEIGGRPLWNGAVGLGKLNYPRDADVEEFFNLAMDGAKDAMRAKWKVADGASREKVARYFTERSDLLPEGLEPVKTEIAGNYRDALGVISILRQLSSEDAGTGFTNSGTEADELEIQAAERQSAAATLISARMADIYDALDDLGTEILRRFLVAPTDEKREGYNEIKAFREDLEKHGITQEIREKIAEVKNGEMCYITVRTVRAMGDGSRLQEERAASQLMASLGAFNPQGQEKIKRRFVLTATRNPDLAAEIVPYEQRTDPDQQARARMENYSAVSRGILGFVPQLNPDDVNGIHVPEHDQELDSLNARSQAAGGMNENDFAGFKSLATHQASHLQNMQGDKALAEQANAWLQKLERQTSTAEGLAKAWASRMQQEEISPEKQIQLQQKERQINLAERAQTSIEADRADRIALDERAQATNEAKMISDAAAKGAGITTAPPPEPAPEPVA